MDALTLWQPYASLIVAGHKTIETRSWGGPSKLIGQRLAIHASKKRISEILHIIDAPTAGAMSGALGVSINGLTTLSVGVVLGTVRVDGAYYVTRVDDHGAHFGQMTRDRTPGSPPLWGVRPSPYEMAFGDISRGRWLWLLSDAKHFERPIAARGAQGVWEWRDEDEEIEERSGG